MDFLGVTRKLIYMGGSWMTFKLLWCSDAFELPTGYSQVTRNVLNNFSKAGVEVHNLAFQNMGFPSNFRISDRMIAPYNVYYQLNPGENYGNGGSVEYYSQHIKPDITAFLCDSFMIKWITDMVEHNGQKMKRRHKIIGSLLFYFPFDSKDVYAGAEDVLETMNIRVAMSKFAQNLLKKETGLESHYIPHGLDPVIYRPLPKHVIEKAKKDNKWEDKFIVGCVGRNQSRKNLPALFKAFKEFSDGKKDTVLFLHADPKDPQGNDLFDLSKKLGIQDKVVFGMKRFSLGEPEFKINLAYNLMDVHVLSTTGEGFGLPIIESMAAGTPNICTDYTSAKELIGNHGLRVPLARGHPYITGQLNTDRALVDISKLANAMERMYNNEALRKKYSKLGRKYVLDNYSWERVMRMWLNLIEHGEANDF